MIALATALVLAGCVSIALSQQHQWKLVSDSLPGSSLQMTMRLAGWVLLGASLALDIAMDGAGFGVLVWVLQIAAACFAIAMVLSFRPGLFRPVVRLYSALRT